MNIPAIRPLAHANPSESRELARAGQQFEALVIRQMLESARPKATGPEAEWRGLADQAMADQVAASSPLGIADLLARTAARKPAP